MELWTTSIKLRKLRHHPLPNLDEPEPNRLLISFGNRLPNGRGISVRFVKSCCFLESGSVYANFCKQALVGPLAARSPGLRLALALEIERHCSTDEILQGRLIDLVAFVDVDGAPDIPVEAGIEQT